MTPTKRIKTLQAFTKDEREKAHTLLAIRVAHMMGRKLEEGDWAEVYCRAKGIPLKGWSNLEIDIMHGVLGVEHKMIRYSSKGDVSEACGTRIMHPSATRAFRVPPVAMDANDAMRDVLVLSIQRPCDAGGVASSDTADQRTCQPSPAIRRSIADPIHDAV